MARAYGRKKRASSPKRKTARKKSDETLTRKRPRVAKSSTVRKSGAKRTSATSKRKRERKVTKKPKKRVAKRPAVAKKPAQKLRRSAKPKRPTKAAAPKPRKTPAKGKAKAPRAKVKAQRAKPRTPAQRRKAEAKTLAKRLAKLERDRKKLDRTRKKRPKGGKRAIAKRLAAIENRRLEEKLASEKLPHATPKQEKDSRDELFERYRAKFDELLREAEETKQTPNVDYQQRKMRSDKTKGDVRVVRIERKVTPRSVVTIMHKVRAAAAKMQGRYPIWMAVLVFSAMGERLVGYGQRVLRSNDRDAAQFQTQGIDSTGVKNTREGMLLVAEDILEDLASETMTIVHCHFVRLMNFKRIS